MAVITPGKKVDAGIPGRSQGRREEGRSLRTGKVTGSTVRGTVAKGPKGQGIKLQRQPTVPTKPALNTEGSGAEGYGIRLAVEQFGRYEIFQVLVIH